MMPFTPKTVLFFLGVLWVIIPSPRTMADPPPGHSSEFPFVIYPMKSKPHCTKDVITCNDSSKDSKGSQGRGFTCPGNDSAAKVLVPVLDKNCRSRAKKLTITVNRDEDVVIEFLKNISDLQMEWGKESNQSFEKINATDRTKLILPHNKTKESGVYLFELDDALPRGLSAKCAVVIIRRECPANRYGEQCSNWCRDCMHGGVCDARTGNCVCPPGMKGELCEEACEGEAILNSCTINPSITKKIQICLPSPYGCSCPPGTTGYNCDEDCQDGRWGVNCLQTCSHCKDGTCNAKTGKCLSGEEDPCAGGPKGYHRFRQEPDIQPDERQATVNFCIVFDGEKPDSENISYQVVIWEKGQNMSNVTTSQEVTDGATSVTIRGLAPATTYYAAVLVKFTLNGRDCKINGTLRGERIQKKMFTTKCPKGRISNLTVVSKTEESFNISWKEEVYARICNYKYEVKVSRVSDRELVSDKVVEEPVHTQEGLKRYTEYSVSVAVISPGVKSEPLAWIIKTLPKRPTTPPSLERFLEEDADSVTYRWNRPSDVEGDIFYKYTYKEKALACDQETKNQLNECTQDTEVSFPNPLPYANITFVVAIGNEAGFSEDNETSYITSSKVPGIKVKPIYCDDHIPPKQCSVTLEDDCRKINGKDLNIQTELAYITNSARNSKSGNIIANHFSPQSIHDNFTIKLPEDLFHHTKYNLTVYVKNDAGTNTNSGFSSKEIITPPVAPGEVNITRASSAHNSINLAWDPPPSFPPTGDIKEYVINVSKTQEKTHIIMTYNTTKETYSILYLDTDVSYTIHVTGINEGVEEPGKAAEIEVATVAQKPSQPINVTENSSLTEIVIAWNDDQGDTNFTLRYELTFQNETYNISKKEHKFTGLQPEHTYPLQVKSCNEWKCSDVLQISISTNPQPPEIEGPIEVLDYSGNVSKMLLPRVKNPPAVQYVVVVEAIETVDDMQIKERALQEVKKYIEKQENNNHKRFKRNTEERVPEIWVAGRFPIENVTTKGVDIGTGVGEDKAFQPDKDYNLVVVTEKKSGHNREFTVSDPVSTKGKAVASGLAGILFGALIFLVLIGLFAWTYKKQRAKIVVRTSNQDGDCFLPGALEKKSSILRKSAPNPDLLVQEFPESPCMADEEIYSNLSRRIRFENVESYLLKAIHSSETDLEFNSVPKVLEKSCSHSEHPENRLKNRYKNNLPYNDTRVRLPRLPQMPFSDYINANYIEGHLHPKAYIATQGPKDFNKDTTGDFWRMIWHTKSQLIIMIANIVENGKVKVAQYWPSEGTMTKGGIDITLEATEMKMDFIIRTFTATSQEETRTIQQYQFTTWPDHGVPENPYGVAHMINSIRSEPLTGPIIVHCSAGIGRTGTILLVLGVMDQINTSGFMDVHEVLVRLRNGRPRLIESTTQYKFGHKILREILCEKQTRFTCRDFPEALLELRMAQTNTNMSRIQQQFHELKQLPKDFLYKFAQRPEVSHLNRDPKILPPDSRLIYLQYTNGRDESQYINAVSVQSVNGQVIVAEHPQRHTISRMWQMVYEKRISVWTLIHSFPQGDTDYPSILPAESEENFDEFNVKVMNHEEYGNFTEYHVTIRPMNSANSAPFHCMIVLMKCWPHTNPSPSSLLPLLAVMERAESLMTTSSAALFTCKDGVTGCGLMMALKQTIDKVKLHQEVDVYHSVQQITYDRPEFIVSEEQYDLVHEGVVLYLSAYSNYGNFN